MVMVTCNVAPATKSHNIAIAVHKAIHQRPPLVPNHRDRSSRLLALSTFSKNKNFCQPSRAGAYGPGIVIEGWRYISHPHQYSSPPEG